MHYRHEISQSFLDEIGGEPLEGSGFESEIPDPSFEIAATGSNQPEPPAFCEKGGTR
jgi:hypothetical protein